MESLDRRNFVFRQGVQGNAVRAPLALDNDVRSAKGQGHAIADLQENPKAYQNGYDVFSLLPASKSSSDAPHRAAVFSSSGAKIHSFNLLPFKQNTLYLPRMEDFRSMLTGGHPNSLGRTLEVVEAVLATPARMEELYQCYFSDDEIVRLRTSSSIKRVFLAHPDWFENYADRLLDEITKIDQPSTKWTLAQLWLEHRKRLTPDQMARAKQNLITVLHEEDDWIALNMSMKTLQYFVKDDPALIPKIADRARELANDSRKSVSKGAIKLLNASNEPLDVLK